MVAPTDKAKPVPPEPTRRRRRRKIPLACEPCRERKSRCDGAKPICSGCQRRSLKLEDCIYSLDNARTASNDDYIKILHDRIRHLEKICPADGTDLPPVSSDVVPDGPGPGLPSRDRDIELSGDCSINAPEPPDTHVELPVPKNNLLPVLPAQPQSTVAQVPAKTSPASSSSQNRAPDISAWKLPPAPGQSTYGISPSHQGSDNASRPSPRVEKQSPDENGVNAMGVISSEDGIVGDSPAARSTGRGYYGGSSAASFIREAFGTINRNTPGGPSTVSAPPFISEPAGGSRPMSLSLATNFALPPRQLADHLLEVFLRRIYYLYPFFYRPAFMKAYRALWEPIAASQDPNEYTGVGLGGSPEEGPNSIVFHCALNGIFALACYSSDLPPDERLSGAETFFLRSKSNVGTSLLEQNNLGAIQALLIGALFLQSTPYPSRCWNSVGVACRLAQGLGLHADAGGQEGRPNTLQREMRLRTWYGCVVLDMLVSMTFGRPTMTTFASNLPLPSIADDLATKPPEGGDLTFPNTDAPTRLQFFAESIRLAKVLEQILVRVYQPWKSKTSGGDQHHFSLDTVVELDAQLTQFEKTVPWPLSWLQGLSPGSLPSEMAPCLRMQRIVLNSRFLYLRLMLFRPVLSQLAADRDKNKAGGPAGPTPNGSILSSSFGIECGKSCAQTAIDLITLTHATYLLDEAGAWWWSGLYASTAGLVLIVARSCPSVWMSMDHSQIQRAWGQCQDILIHLSNVSISCRKSLQLLQAIYESSNSQVPGKLDTPLATTHILTVKGAQSVENEQFPRTDSTMPPVPMPEPVDGTAGADMFGFMDMDMMNTALMSWDQGLDIFDFSNGM